MFVENSGIIRFEPKNEGEQKLLDYIKRKNGWHGGRRFNSIKDNYDGTVTLFLKDGYETMISKHRLSEVIQAGKVTPLSSPFGFYVGLNFNGKMMTLQRFLMRNELAKYEGFEETTGLKLQVNHIDEDTLNNEDENLEVVTEQENKLKNRLIHSKGYCKIPNGKLRVLVCRKHIGTFETESEARQAYVKVVKEEIKRYERIRHDFLKDNGRL
ncbi:HNH endonuclease [Bacillus infantis]|uniref:HNH endonuclease n=1 Tax=Bacillus infantis TaxID=324767 RepID=UPI003CEDD9FC